MRESILTIRASTDDDIDEVMGIWLEGNIQVHGFVPAGHWTGLMDEVRGMIASADVHVCVAEGGIVGFIGMTDDRIEGLFVKDGFRGCGVGGSLLGFAKETHDALSLNVYARNGRAVRFYIQEGFTIDSESVDPDTGEPDLHMSWNNLHAGS